MSTVEESQMSWIIVVLLAGVVFLLHKIRVQLTSIMRFMEEEAKYNELSEYAPKHTVKDWLLVILHRLNDSLEHSRNIDYALNCDNPAGHESAATRRTHNLIELYSKYLMRNGEFTQQEADAKAAFEFNEFNTKQMIDAINGGGKDDWNERRARERSIVKAFMDTGLLEKDCQAHKDKLIPHDLFAPVWIMFNKYSYPASKNGWALELDSYEEEYADYVKNRSIVLRLLELGVIEKLATKAPDDYWLNDPVFKFTTDSIDALKNIIYKGGPAHDDEHFQERYRDGSLKAIFKYPLLYRGEMDD